jgi:uracil-DNA glycosylase
VDTSWKAALTEEFDQSYFQSIVRFVRRERCEHEVYPPAGQVFGAFSATPLDKVRVLILGQDPYHGPGQAHGLSFSVPDGVLAPPSLKNIHKELFADLGVQRSHLDGNLIGWAKQGVLLLNSVLTVRAHEAGSHRGQGWETFTDAVIKLLSDRDKPMIFILWGRYAQAKADFIDENKHVFLKAAHPSPMSAGSGFFGSRPFSKTNAALQQFGGAPIDWRV